jgi:hypothetical protein
MAFNTNDYPDPKLVAKKVVKKVKKTTPILMENVYHSTNMGAALLKSILAEITELSTKEVASITQLTVGLADCNKDAPAGTHCFNVQFSYTR